MARLGWLLELAAMSVAHESTSILTGKRLRVYHIVGWFVCIRSRDKEWLMMKVEQLQIEIEALPEEDFSRLRRWFAEKDWELWDNQVESDVAAGKLDFLLDEVSAAKMQGKLREL